jgi:hypothetical protein
MIVPSWKRIDGLSALWLKRWFTQRKACLASLRRFTAEFLLILTEHEKPTLQVCPHIDSSTLLQCEYCNRSFEPKNKRQRFCEAKCRAAAYYLPILLFNRERKNARFAALSRDKALGFDGCYNGPPNSAYCGEASSIERLLAAIRASCELVVDEV